MVYIPSKKWNFGVVDFPGWDDPQGKDIDFLNAQLNWVKTNKQSQTQSYYTQSFIFVLF